MGTLNAFETIQFALEPSAISINLSSLTPSIFEAFKSRWIPATLKVVVSRSKVASVSRSPGVKPAWLKPKLTAIVKQPACAAAINSSGLVPTPSAKRVLNEYWVLLRVVLWVVRSPLPSWKVPFQCACAVRFIVLVIYLWNCKVSVDIFDKIQYLVTPILCFGRSYKISRSFFERLQQDVVKFNNVLTCLQPRLFVGLGKYQNKGQAFFPQPIAKLQVYLLRFQAAVN